VTTDGKVGVLIEDGMVKGAAGSGRGRGMNAVAKAEAPLQPGIYEGLPMADYLAMPAASASTDDHAARALPARRLVRLVAEPAPPAHRSTPAQSVGTLAHELLLEGTPRAAGRDRPERLPDEDHGRDPDGWTNKAIKRRARRRARRRQDPGLPGVAAEIEAMVARRAATSRATRESEPAIHDLFQPAAASSEVTIVWEEDGCLFRMRPDRIAAA
jgi:hypothetical protein